MSAKLSRDLAAAVASKRYKPADGIGLTKEVVDAAIWAIVGVVRQRSAAGERTFWRWVGVFEPVEVKSRRRWVLRRVAQWRWDWMFVQFPAYTRLRFRRSAYMNKLR